MKLPATCVFALINEQDKRVYVGYSLKLQSRLGTIATQILDKDWKYGLMVEDQAKLELKILETRSDVESLKLFVNYFIAKYRNMGYHVYNKDEKPHLHYTFKVIVTSNGADVVAANKRNDKIILGSFAKYRQATLFLNYVKAHNKCNGLIYSCYNIEKGKT